MPAILDKKIIVADSRGRVALGVEAKGRIFSITVAADGEFTITPMAVMPEREAWLWRNPEDRASFDKGVQEAREGLGVPMDFSQYLEADSE
jgi:ABC-type proline/glycine betaine transport system substrate-binding protein